MVMWMSEGGGMTSSDFCSSDVSGVVSFEGLSSSGEGDCSVHGLDNLCCEVTLDVAVSFVSADEAVVSACVRWVVCMLSAVCGCGINIIGVVALTVGGAAALSECTD